MLSEEDHILGTLEMLEDPRRPVELGGIWINDDDQLQDVEIETFGVRDGEKLSTALLEQKLGAARFHFGPRERFHGYRADPSDRGRSHALRHAGTRARSRNLPCWIRRFRSPAPSRPAAAVDGVICKDGAAPAGAVARSPESARSSTPAVCASAPPHIGDTNMTPHPCVHVPSGCIGSNVLVVLADAVGLGVRGVPVCA